MKHPNIVGYKESFLDGGNLYIVMDFADGGMLSSLLSSNVIVLWEWKNFSYFAPHYIILSYSNPPHYHSSLHVLFSSSLTVLFLVSRFLVLFMYIIGDMYKLIQDRKGQYFKEEVCLFFASSLPLFLLSSLLLSFFLFLSLIFTLLSLTSPLIFLLNSKYATGLYKYALL